MPTRWSAPSGAAPARAALLSATAAVHAQFDRLLDYVDGKLPEVHEHLDAARADILAFTDFPKDVWTQIWSNNPAERLNREIRRRTDAVEQTDEWAEGRRYLGLGVARCCMNVVTAT